MAETSHERFRRLAEKRVARTIREIRLIANLSNRSNYSYERVEVEKIFRTLDKELKLARARFEGGRNSEDIVFSLSE